MRTFVIAAALAALAAGPALAQDPHAGHHPAPAAGAAQDPTTAPTHEMCKSVMGRQMHGKDAHDHGRDKTGAVTLPNGKPLSAAEMEKMHKVCAEKMKSAEAPAKK